MPEQKTKPTEQTVDSFLRGLPDPKVAEDCRKIIGIMKRVTGLEPKMWGNIIGFGKYHYKYESGHEGFSCLTGLSPRKQNISLYVMLGLIEDDAILENLGKYKAGKGCLYIKSMDEINVEVLEKIVRTSVEKLKKKYPEK
jgi:hypothetical protein